MKMNTRSRLVATAAGMLTVGIILVALPASASETPITLTVTGGALMISAPTGSVSLGSQASSGSATNVSNTLGSVQVRDARSGETGWVASVGSTAFAPALDATAIPDSAVGYAVGNLTASTGTATFTRGTDASLASLGSVLPVLTATDVNLDNSATWNPTINLAVPADIAAGTYIATISHSVL